MTAGANNNGGLPADRTEGPSRTAFMIAFLLVTLLGVTAGSLLGFYVQPAVKQNIQEESTSGETSSGEGRVALRDGNLLKLPPIITNLAGPQSTWIRLEAAAVLTGDPAEGDELLASEIAQDIVSFLRTVSIADIETASGYEHFREDLKDRVRTRTDGRARDLIIYTFITE